MTCRLCGGDAGQLNAEGAHNLCTARAALDLPTPNLGTRCGACEGRGYRPRSAVCPAIDPSPAAIRAWAQPCPACNAKGYTA